MSGGSWDPTSEERARRDEVLARIVVAIKGDVVIKLPPFDASQIDPSQMDPSLGGSGEFALHRLEENDFSGVVGSYRYQFEGEEDLLHLIVARVDRKALTVQAAREVARFVLPNVPPAVIWLKPGEFTQHFYLGHDELL